MDDTSAASSDTLEGSPAASAAPRPRAVRSPLAAAAALLAGGVIVGRYIDVPVGLWGILGVVGMLAAAATSRREALVAVTTGGIICAIAATGALSASLAWRRVPADHIVRRTSGDPVMATIRGTIASSVRIVRAPAAYDQPEVTTFTLDCSEILDTRDRWLPAEGRIRVTVREPFAAQAGDDVELVGQLTRPRPPSNPGQYDWAEADRTRGILARFTVPVAEGVTRRPGNPSLPVRLWRRLRRHARVHVSGLGDESESSLLKDKPLGERDPALRRLNRAMVQAGTAHFLSISGMHVWIFLVVVYTASRLATLGPRRSAIIVLIVLAGYLLIVEPRAPLLRATIMAAAICVAVISGRGVSTANALSTAAIILLAFDPLGLFRPGFQLSVAIVTGLLVMHKPLKQAIFGRWIRRRGLMVFRTDQRMARFVRYRLADWAMSLVSASLAAYLAAAPLVAYHFGLFTPYAPLLTILLLPLVVLVLAPAYVSLALSGVAPSLAVWVGRLATGPARALEGVVDLAGHLPGLSFDVRPVPISVVAACYAAMALWAWRPKRIRLWAPVAALALAAALLTQRTAPAPANGRLHVFDVGRGSMILLHAPNGETVLFDAGSLGSANAFDDVLRPFLRSRRLPMPKTVFISHPNIDHFNAMFGLLAHRRPRTLYAGATFGEADGPPEAGELVKLCRRLDVPIVRLERPGTISLGERTHVEVCWPEPQRRAGLSLNDRSLVLRLTCGGRSVLLPGDIERTPQSELARMPGAGVKSDVLVLPHHGAYTDALPAFIRAVDPELILQSVSRRKDSQDLLKALGGRRRLVTWRDGWIGVELRDGGPVAETMR